jgi:hypothetical protein
MADETGGALVPAEPAAPSGELAEIQETMRTAPEKYWRDPAMQRRLYQLSGGKSETPVAAEGVRGDLAQSEAGKALIADWDKGRGGFDGTLEAVNAEAGRLLSGFDHADFMSAYAGLPIGCRCAVAQGLALGKPNFVPPASKTAVENFASTEDGAALVKEWGARAPENVAMIRARIEGVRSRMSETEREEFGDWLDRIPDGEWIAIARGLVR